MTPVKEVMTTEVVSFREDTPVMEIADRLSSAHITGAPVVTEEGFVVGIVSEVDVFSKRGTVARDIMSPHVISITEDTGIEEAASLLAGERIRRLPVLRQGRLVGLVSRSDVLDFFATRMWTCTACGQSEHGLEQPASCASCSGTSFTLERAHPRH
ncbi:MAG TPA: CBS domain-containing protein [Candidatus Dormibacteraeota bacterium]|nr:CBS domain-containing protein [Candidatus Dormibacteraeota bacterium]